MKKITVYYSSVSSNLVGKKNTQSLEFLLQGKKLNYDLVDLTTMEKAARDAVFDKAKSRDFPLLFVDGEAIGNFEVVQDLIENEELDAKLK